jgi:(4S)-4-hydroxy-5-phosphonooxypentane-2,3-dione isomerase
LEENVGFTVVAQWTPKPGEETVVEEAIRGLAVASRAEPGCLQYIVNRAVDESGTFILVEQYVDEHAYQAHTESAHFRHFALELGIPRLERRERIFGVELL